MRRVFSFIFLLFLQSTSFAFDILRAPEPNSSLRDRVQWALRSATEKDHFWVGYSITRLAPEDSAIISGFSFNGDFERRLRSRPSLLEQFTGVKIEPENVGKAATSELKRLESQKSVKVWKPTGIFQKFQRGKKLPERVQVIDLNLSATFDRNVYWLGPAKQEESFQYLTELYSKMSESEKEDLICGIGIHPSSLVFPFLRKILTSDEPESAQEAAAVSVGELADPESLSLLQQVANTNPHSGVQESAVVGIAEIKSDESMQVLSQIARSHPRKNLRESALAMLANNENPLAVKILEEVAWFDPDEDIRQTAVMMLAETKSGVKALLKIMDEHPSKETRETAVRALAETVAGRQILKEKIHQ
jgi:HEAT repeats